MGAGFLSEAWNLKVLVYYSRSGHVQIVCDAVAWVGAASTRVANELGSAKPLRAEKAAYTAIALETLLMLGIVAVGFGLRDVWAYLFTDDPEVSAVPAGCVSG